MWVVFESLEGGRACLRIWEKLLQWPGHGRQAPQMLERVVESGCCLWAQALNPHKSVWSPELMFHWAGPQWPATEVAGLSQAKCEPGGGGLGEAHPCRGSAAGSQAEFRLGHCPLDGRNFGLSLLSPVGSEGGAGSFPFCGRRWQPPHGGDSEGGLWGRDRMGTDADQPQANQKQK